MLKRGTRMVGWWLLAAGWAGCLAAPNGPPEPLPYDKVGVLELKVVKEPSGVCYHSQRGTLFVVDDGGTVCEFKPDGTVVKHKHLRNADFEGITHDPATGRLYLAIEGAESILEVDPDTFRVRREFALPRTFEGRTVMKEGGQGIEGLTFVPDKKHPHGGTFFVANQSFRLDDPEDLSAIFEVEIPLKDEGPTPGEPKILRCIKAPVVDISGLCYDASSDLLFAISDATDRMMSFARDGTLRRTWTLPGNDQEGIALDADRFLYVAQDSGGVLKLTKRKGG
jgi:hypothetical protein